MDRLSCGGDLMRCRIRGKGKVFTQCVVVCLIVLLLASAESTRGAALRPLVPLPGDLDRTFGGDGRITTNLERANALIMQPDRKIVAAGTEFAGSELKYDFALARYNPDGSLDPTFDGDGIVTTDFNRRGEIANAVALQPDGKIIAAGYIGEESSGLRDFALARYLPDGSLDPTFDEDGMLTTDVGGDFDQANSVAVQPDGKILAAGLGHSSGGGASGDFAVARYNSDGSLDVAFSGDGMLTTDFGGFDLAQAMLLQPDARILVAGSALSADTYADFALARYLPDGSLDPTFNEDGMLTTDFDRSHDTATALALQFDARIVVAGYVSGEYNSDFGLVRYSPEGILDSDFGTEGKVTTDFEGNVDRANALAIEANGKIIAAGFSGPEYPQFEEDFALARYDPEGNLDAGFNEDGKLTTNFEGSDDFANALVLQPDHKIIVAGYTRSRNGIGFDFALARYEGGSAELCTIRFSDVPPTNTFYPYVRKLACRAILGGYDNGTFRPDNSMTRGQLAKIVSNAAHFTEDPGAQIFEDVSPSHTFYSWINRLARRGYMGGYPCGGTVEPCVSGDRPYFRPTANATRAQTAKIVSNTAGYDELPTEQTFEDVLPSHPFYREIQRLTSRGIMGGYECGAPGEPCGPASRPYFRPSNDMTRGQSAKIVANTFLPDLGR